MVERWTKGITALLFFTSVKHAFIFAANLFIFLNHTIADNASGSAIFSTAATSLPLLVIYSGAIMILYIYSMTITSKHNLLLGLMIT